MKIEKILLEVEKISYFHSNGFFFSFSIRTNDVTFVATTVKLSHGVYIYILGSVK